MRRRGSGFPDSPGGVLSGDQTVVAATGVLDEGTRRPHTVRYSLVEKTDLGLRATHFTIPSFNLGDVR